MAINTVLELHEKVEEGRYQRSLEEREWAMHYLKRGQFLGIIERDLRTILQKFETAEEEGIIGPKGEEVRNLIEKAYGVI
jgi:hypothetical protein